LTGCSIQAFYPSLYDIASDKNITMDKVIGFNRYYLTFNRPLNNILYQQLHALYIQLSHISLTMESDSIKWRWNTNGLFSIKSCYTWLDYGGIPSTRYQSI
jgi:hypothetical protein